MGEMVEPRGGWYGEESSTFMMMGLLGTGAARVGEGERDGI
jgi:hypothetical protein